MNIFFFLLSSAPSRLRLNILPSSLHLVNNTAVTSDSPGITVRLCLGFGLHKEGSVGEGPTCVVAFILGVGEGSGEGGCTVVDCMFIRVGIQPMSTRAYDAV